MSSTEFKSPAPAPTRFTGWRAALAISLVVLLGAAMLFAAAEGAVRVRQWLRHGALGSFDSLYVVDPASGLRVPRASTKLGGVSINSSGFRGPEIELPKPPKRVRIAFVGASTTYCAEVSSDAAVWTQGVTDLLQRQFPQVSFDFINAGVPGYSVVSSMKHFEQYVKPLQADAVMIYHGTNDMSGELRALAATQGLWRDGDVQSWLARQSLLIDLVEKNLRVRAAGQQIDAGAQRLEFNPHQIGQSFDADLRSLISHAAQNATHVSIATFSARIRREQSPEARKAAAVSALVYMPFMSLEGLLNAYQRYNDVIRSVASQTGALLIDGENDIPGDAAHFVDSVHFSDQGSAAMARRVAKALANDPGFKALVANRTTTSAPTSGPNGERRRMPL